MRQYTRSFALICLGLVFGLFTARTLFRPPLPSPVPAVDAGLDRLVTIDFRETPIIEAIEELQRQAGANIVVQWTSLEYLGIDMGMAVTLQLKQVPLRVALKYLLARLGEVAASEMDRMEPSKAVFIERDGVIVISRPEDVEQVVIVRIYDVPSGGSLG